jgi:hypothetical protein
VLLLGLSQGSSVQLPSYGWAKGILADQGWSPDGFATFLTASAVSGVCVVSLVAHTLNHANANEQCAAMQ